jgi:hypothetical protein
MKIGSMIAMAAIAGSVAFAQNDVIKLQVENVISGGVSRGISIAKFGLMGPTVKGAPYSADGVTETTQTLGDGTHINRQETYTIYRDGEGRIRRESGDEVWISDPVAKTSYVLHPKQQTARKLGLSNAVVKLDKQMAVPPPPPPPPPPGVADKLAEAKADAVYFRQSADGKMWQSDAGKTEALGKQSMEGVEVEGSRTTTVIPQGKVGNDRPMQMVRERWESADLHVTVLSKHLDPMMGDTVERLTNIQRVEPDPALFQIPAGYAVIEEDQ